MRSSTHPCNNPSNTHLTTPQNTHASPQQHTQTHTHTHTHTHTCARALTSSTALASSGASVMILVSPLSQSCGPYVSRSEAMPFTGSRRFASACAPLRSTAIKGPSRCRPSTRAPMQPMLLAVQRGTPTPAVVSVRLPRRAVVPLPGVDPLGVGVRGVRSAVAVATVSACRAACAYFNLENSAVHAAYVPGEDDTSVGQKDVTPVGSSLRHTACGRRIRYPHATNKRRVEHRGLSFTYSE